MKFWAIDSPVMRVLGRLGDIIILNMIFVVGCIPVITIGTSLSALYAVAMKMARGEDRRCGRNSGKPIRGTSDRQPSAGWSWLSLPYCCLWIFGSSEF